MPSPSFAVAVDDLTGADVRARQSEVYSPRDHPAARRVIELQRLPQMPARVVEAADSISVMPSVNRQSPRSVEPMRRRQRESFMRASQASPYCRDVWSITPMSFSSNACSWTLPSDSSRSSACRCNSRARE